MPHCVNHEVRRISDYVLALASCAVCLASFFGVFTPLGLVALVKLLLTMTLLIASALSPWRNSAGAVAMVIFTTFAAYNAGGVITGRNDCGCFPIRIAPMFIGAMDAGFALWFSWRSGMFGERRKWSLALLPVLVGSFIVGAFAPKGQEESGLSTVENMAINLVSSPLPRNGQQLLPAYRYSTVEARKISFYRNSCSQCQAQLDILHLMVPPTVDPLQASLKVEIDTGHITTLDGDPTPDAELLRPLINRARFWPVPILITVVDGKVVAVEDRSAKH